MWWLGFLFVVSIVCQLPQQTQTYQDLLNSDSIKQRETATKELILKNDLQLIDKLLTTADSLEARTRLLWIKDQIKLRQLSTAVSKIIRHYDTNFHDCLRNIFCNSAAVALENISKITGRIVLRDYSATTINRQFIPHNDDLSLIIDTLLKVKQDPLVVYALLDTAHYLHIPVTDRLATFLNTDNYYIKNKVLDIFILFKYEKEPQFLLNCLDDSDFTAKAIRALNTIHKDVYINTIAEYRDSENEEILSACLDAFQNSDKYNNDVIRLMTNCPYWHIRDKAIQILRHKRTEKISDHIALALSDSNERVRFSALKALYYTYANAKYADKILPLLTDPYTLTRSMVLDYLQAIKAKQFGNEIGSVITNKLEMTRIRLQAMRVLDTFQDNTLYSYVKSVLYSDDPGLIVQAIKSIALTYKEHIKEIEPLLKSVNDDIRVAAANALYDSNEEAKKILNLETAAKE